MHGDTRWNLGTVGDPNHSFLLGCIGWDPGDSYAFDHSKRRIGVCPGVVVGRVRPAAESDPQRPVTSS